MLDTSWPCGNDLYESSVLLQLDGSGGEARTPSRDEKTAGPSYAKGKLDSGFGLAPADPRASLPFPLKAVGVLVVRGTEDEGDRLAEGDHDAEAEPAQKGSGGGPGRGSPGRHRGPQSTGQRT